MTEFNQELLIDIEQEINSFLKYTYFDHAFDPDYKNRFFEQSFCFKIIYEASRLSKFLSLNSKQEQDFFIKKIIEEFRLRKQDKSNRGFTLENKQSNFFT